MARELLARFRNGSMLAAAFCGGSLAGVMLGRVPGSGHLTALLCLASIVTTGVLSWLLARVSRAPSHEEIPADNCGWMPSDPQARRRRAPLGLPAKEHLLVAVDRSIADGCDRAAFAIIELKDFDRLYPIDPDDAVEALAAFANRIREVVGQKFVVAHIERGVFGLWLSGLSVEAARACLSTTAYALRGEIRTGSFRVLPDVGFKLGIYPDDGTDAECLVTKTLLSARSGEQPGIVPEPPLIKAQQQYSLEQALRRSVDRQELTLKFQPIVDIERGKIVSAEALLRWRHPEWGDVSPAKFIPLLEEINLINEIGMWSLNAACAALHAWHGMGHSHLTAAVNLSPLQLQDPNLEEAVGRTLERYGIPARSLTLELTETAAAQDIERTTALFFRLKDLGVGLSIDDFGTGYSSLSHLMKLPFDKLKIDRAFVSDVHLDHQKQAICRSLVELARGLQIDLVAEGAERVEEVEVLQRAGCSLIQGFYFSKPVSSDEIPLLASKTHWLNKGAQRDRPVRARA